MAPDEWCVCLVKCANTILGRNMGSREEVLVLVSGRDAGVGTDSWIGVDSWGGEMSWSGAEHPSWAKTPQLGGTAAMGGKARAGVESPSRCKTQSREKKTDSGQKQRDRGETARMRLLRGFERRAWLSTWDCAAWLCSVQSCCDRCPWIGGTPAQTQSLKKWPGGVVRRVTGG